MLNLNLPETSEHPFLLKQSVERGTSFVSSLLDTHPLLKSWVALSEITSLKLTKDITTDDEDATNFILAEGKLFNFYYVRLGCSFHPSQQEKFDQAWLQVRLAPANDLIGGSRSLQVMGDLPLATNQQAALLDSPDFSRQRLETQRAHLQTEWTIRSEKLAVLRQARVIEASPDRWVQLDQQVQTEEQEIQSLESELSKIEQTLNNDTLPSPATQSQSPFVWSMKPLDSYETVEVTSSAMISSKLTLISGETSGNSSQQEKKAYKNYFLRAFGEGTSNPFWEFKKTEVAEINGSYRFHMIVRAAVGMQVNGTIELFTRVQRKKYLIIPLVEDLTDKPVLSFHLF